MGNELADAIRDELRAALLREYGTLDVAATRIGLSYKTLYRALTTRGKDRSQSVKLDLVVDIAEHLGIPFGTIYDSAKANVRDASNVHRVDFSARGGIDLRAAATVSDDPDDEPDNF